MQTRLFMPITYECTFVVYQGRLIFSSYFSSKLYLLMIIFLM